MTSTRLIRQILVSWIGIRTTTNLPYAPAKLRRSLSNRHGYVTLSTLWYCSALPSAILFQQLTCLIFQCFQSYLDDSQRSREQSWLKNLGSSNSSGLYQGPSGGAVTAAGARAKGRSSKMVAKPSNPREERRKPMKEPSMLTSALRKGKAT